MYNYQIMNIPFQHFLLSIAIFAGILISPTLAHADKYAHCDPKKTQTWIKAEALIAEGKELLDQGSAMWVNNEPGWGDVLKESRAKSKEGYALKEQARREARLCRNGTREEAKKERQRRLSEKGKDHLKTEAKARVIAKLREEFPNTYKVFGATNLAKNQWQLLTQQGTTRDFLKNITDSVIQLRSFPSLPNNPAWSLSGDLLRVSLTEYRSIVGNALTDLESSLSEFDSSHSQYMRSLRKSYNSYRKTERSWRSWKRPFRSNRGGGGRYSGRRDPRCGQVYAQIRAYNNYLRNSLPYSVRNQVIRARRANQDWARRNC